MVVIGVDSHKRTHTVGARFFASLKGECLDQRTWPTRAAARRGIVDDIAWYDGSLLHGTLGYTTPNEFETGTGNETLAKVA